jgi:hypothetical protein
MAALSVVERAGYAENLFAERQVVTGVSDASYGISAHAWHGKVWMSLDM